MNRTLQKSRRATVMTGALLVSAIAHAQMIQVAPAGAAEATEESSDEDIIVLSPFEVTSESESGYLATETLAGTRLRTSLRDVGSAISVVTEQFMVDVGATDTSTLLQYTTNSEVAGVHGTYTGLGNGTTLDETGNLRGPGQAQRIRGLDAADNTRDFFVTDIPWDSYNVDRIDIQRGPNGILFGLGSPAGIINASMRNAVFDTTGQIGVRIGSYGSWRANLDYNQEVVEDQLAIRVAGLWDHEKFRQDPAFENDERYYGALRWDPNLFNNESSRTSIKAKYEHGEIDANRPRTVTPIDNLSPWFRSRTVSPGNPFGGMGKQAVNNGYDSWRSDVANIVAGDGLGLQQSSTVNYQPYLTSIVNQQQPYWLLDGATGALIAANGGYIGGGRNSDGSAITSSNSLAGRRYADQFFGVNGLANAANNADLPLSEYGQYRNQSMTDPTIFDFYNELIDGDTKSEFENWDAYNFDVSQTFMDDRLGVQLIYDRQKYERGGQAFLGGSPAITLDILRNFQDYYLTGADPRTATTNPNFGRPYVTSQSGGSGDSYESNREYVRASVYGEIRTEDFTNSDFLVKLLGKHRLNGVYSKEEYGTENKAWVENANSQAWAGYWNGNSGNGSSITDRPPVGVVYLGSSIADQTSASGANIPRITAPVALRDAGMYVFDPSWTNFGVGFDDPWTPPASVSVIYDPANPPATPGAWLQASNPANYRGWNSGFFNDLLEYNNGADNSLLRRAQMAERQTTSWAASWQGFWWNDALVTTLGWRNDEVKGKDITAPTMSLNRSILNLQPDVYRLPDEFPENQTFDDDSTSYGAVLHLNRLFGDDPLPINVSLSYNQSENFQVTNTRRNLYGEPIGNPTGETTDYGVVLSTKDNRYSFRAISFETKVNGASSGLSNSGGLGGVIQQGLRFRNVFLYDLSVYDWGTRGSWASRNNWGGSDLPDNLGAADRTITFAEGRALEDAAITTWNEIQAYLDERGFFQAWGFNPVALDKLTDRSTYEATLPRDGNGDLLTGTDANPAPQYMPDPANVYAYGATQPQGFTVTADTVSKGYEFEFTANPLPNWRMTFNASKSEASRSNVGGPLLDEFIAYLDSQLIDTPAGDMPQFGNTGLSIYANSYGPWRANYALMKLQEGTDAPEIREWRFNAITNYSFTEGFLKGVGVGGAWRWQDNVVIGYPIDANGDFILNEPYQGPKEAAIDLWVSYDRPINDKIHWSVQLNVRNAFASDDLIPISVQPDGSWGSVRISPDQEWFLTNTFSF